MKKIILLISLISILASCGGGGGSAPQTSTATPIGPTPGKTNTDSGNIHNDVGKTNTGIGNVDIGSGNTGGTNNGQLIPPQNTVPGSVPQFPSVDNRFPKPSDARNVTGQGVKVGVLDSDFLSGDDAKTKDFHTKLVNGGFLEGETFTQVINEEFGNRFTAINKTLGANSTLSRSEHGLMVATILAGNSGKGAKGASVYGVSFGEVGTKLIVDKSKYEELYNSGVRIFNQSFGTPSEFSDYDSTNYKLPLRPSVLKEKESTVDVLDRRIDEINDFYKMAVSNGGLFVWAAGNTTPIAGGGRTTYNAPTIQAGMPAYIPELHKGWIAAIGVRPDGTEYNPHLARAGAAMWWSVSANGNCELEGCSAYGSSFAAPRVTAAAVKVKEKFPWMTGHELKQTILTTAKDLGQPGVDTIFGWGLLDETKALKGPAKFSSELLVGKSAADAGLRGMFNANIPDNITSIFENDIDGNGGLEKSGNGKLILTGNNTYDGATEIKGGTLEIYGENGSNIDIEQNGTLITYPTTMIGKKNRNGTFTPISVQNSGGTFENRGSGAVITGDYNAGNGAVTKAEIGTKLTVKGRVNLNGDTVLEQTMGNRYITAKGMTSTVIEAEGGVNGQFSKVEMPEMIAFSVNSDDNKVDVTVKRKNVEEYISELPEADAMRKDVAENLEASFKKLDEEVEKGNGAIEKFALGAAQVQAMSLPTRAAVLDSLSGQIYASAQALTFQHSQTVNKDLSNRLVMLGTLENVGDNAGVWVTGIGASGKLKQEGFGEGNTKVYGGQAGIDRQFGKSLILGTALSYSTSKVNFDRHGGKSDADSFGISLYGRLGNREVPYYLQGRIGAGFVDSNVERDIILGTSDVSRAKINHKDTVYSGYLETGYDVRKGNFTLTPYVGLSHDTVRRGGFTEENSQFGLTAGKKTYSQTAGLVGLRVGQGVNWSNGSKSTFQAYVTHQRAFKEQDLSFDAAYTGLSNAKFTVKGIGLSKNQTWVGAGVLTEVNPGFAWYVNYDGKIDRKGSNNIFTTGLRFSF